MSSPLWEFDYKVQLRNCSKILFPSPAHDWATMEAGSSQAATAALGPLHELPRKERKERKPRHKLKKGKEREQDGHIPLAPKVALGSVAAADDASTWAWAALADISVSNRPPIFTSDCRCVRYYMAVSATQCGALQILFLNSGVSREDLCYSYWSSCVYFILL
jgi:hypothetical protein